MRGKVEFWDDEDVTQTPSVQMEPVLVDTSVWVDWFNEKNKITGQTDFLSIYFDQEIPVYITAVILQEVLQGVRKDNMYKQVEEVLLSVSMLLLDLI